MVGATARGSEVIWIVIGIFVALYIWHLAAPLLGIGQQPDKLSTGQAPITPAPKTPVSLQ